MALLVLEARGDCIVLGKRQHALFSTSATSSITDLFIPFRLALISFQVCFIRLPASLNAEKSKVDGREYQNSKKMHIYGNESSTRLLYVWHLMQLEHIQIMEINITLLCAIITNEVDKQMN